MPEKTKEDEACSICYQRLDDMRMLPCWHIACITCILGMTQTGRGRAVSCHVCRAPCLFENIRSIPRPVRCHACKGFVKNPKKFLCCSRLYCTECVNGFESTNGQVTCRNLCTAELYDISSLPKARICCTCFCLHVEQPDKCGHSLCKTCSHQYTIHERECPVCLALKNPNPSPTDPTRPSQGQRVPLNDREVDPVQIITVIRKIQAGLQANAKEKNKKFYQKIFGAGYTPERANRDIWVGGVFLIIMLLIGIYGGVDYKLWFLGIPCATSLGFRVNFNCLLCYIIGWGLWFTSLYYYFWEHMPLLLFDVMEIKLLPYITDEYFPDIENKKRPTQCFLFAVGIFIYSFCSPIFLHRFALMILRDYLWSIIAKRLAE